MTNLQISDFRNPWLAWCGGGGDGGVCWGEGGELNFEVCASPSPLAYLENECGLWVHMLLQWQQQNVYQTLKLIYNSQLELSGVSYMDFGEKWPSYNGTTLCLLLGAIVQSECRYCKQIWAYTFKTLKNTFIDDIKVI